MIPHRTLLILILTAVSLASPLAMAADPSPPGAGRDLFMAGSRTTGLDESLWRGSSRDLALHVFGSLPNQRLQLSPAGKALALRVLRTAAFAPDGASADSELAAARTMALIGLGDYQAADASIATAPGMAGSEPLSHAAVEAALWVKDDARACAIAAALPAEREGLYAPYWLRLRIFCQAAAGQSDAARANLKAYGAANSDPEFIGLMEAWLNDGSKTPSWSGDPLVVRLLQRMDLQTTPPPELYPPLPARFQPYVVAWKPTGKPAIDAVGDAIAKGDLKGARAARAAVSDDPRSLLMLDALIAAATGQPAGPLLDELVERSYTASGSDWQVAALYLAALGQPMNSMSRLKFTSLSAGPSVVPTGMRLELERASEAGLRGETVLLALEVATLLDRAEELTPPDRALIIHALHRVGLDEDARAFAVEGFLAMRFR